MARKTAEESQKTRDSILDAAEISFLKHGVSNATMADIATTAGISRGAVYGHYKSKDEVFIAMCDRGLSTIYMPDISNSNIPALELFVKSGMNFLIQSSEKSSIQHVIKILSTRCERHKENTTVWRYIQSIQANADSEYRKLIELALRNKELPQETNISLASIFFDSLLQGLHVMLLNWEDRFSENKWDKVEKILRAGVDTLKSSVHVREHD